MSAPIAARHQPRMTLAEPADVTIVGFVSHRDVYAIFIREDGRLSADVLDAFSECRVDFGEPAEITGRTPTVMIGGRPWLPMSSAPVDGTVVELCARYENATAGFPRFAEVIVPWAWRPCDSDWPSEGEELPA